MFTVFVFTFFGQIRRSYALVLPESASPNSGWHGEQIIGPEEARRQQHQQIRRHRQPPRLKAICHAGTATTLSRAIIAVGAVKGTG